MFLNIIKKFLTLDTQTVQKLVEGKAYSSEKELEDEIARKLPEFFHVPIENVKQQYNFKHFIGERSSIADIVVFSKYSKSKIFLVIEVEREKNLRFEMKDEENLDKAYRQLYTYCLEGRVPYGMIITEKRCWLYAFDFKESVLVEKNRLNFILKPFFMDMMPDKLFQKKLLKYYLLFLLLVFLYVLIKSILEVYL